jgi:hypothetical protein
MFFRFWNILKRKLLTHYFSRVLASAKAIAMEHGIDVFTDIFSKIRDPLHYFLVFDVTYMPQSDPVQFQILQQLGASDEQARRGRLSQILEKCETHAAGRKSRESSTAS